ncbi:MAG: tetratricopeptide repeat protein [Alcanivoracaceae bacterium]
MFARRSRRFLLSLAVATALTATPAMADSSALVGAARADISAGEAGKAFDSLSAAEAQHAGDIEFDYWLGFAANRAGQSGRALFALERVLAQNPNHAAARLELALAYARLNLGDAARRELDTLDAQSPPPAAQAQINELRRQLGLGDQARRLEKRVAYVSLEAGYDDNTGSYPKDFGLPGLPGPDEIASPYLTLSAGVRQRVDLKSNQRLTFSLNGLLRRHTDDGDDPLGNDDATQFDQDFVGGRAEWSRDLDGRREFALAADLGYLRLDGERYYDYVGADAEWRQQRDDRTRTLFTVGVRNMSFEADQYDNLMSRVRGGVRHQLNRSWRLEGDVTMEYEAAKNDRPGGDAIRASLRGVAGWQFRPDQRLSGDLTFTRTDYTKEYGAPFNDSRSDDRWMIGAQWDKTFQQLWQVRARLQYRDQNSTLTTYTFDQTSGSVSLTRYF